MKKKILLVISFVLVTILTLGVTLALLTSEDSDHNTMTIGKAKIEQLEYQRVVDENGNWVSTGQEDQYGFTPDKIEEFEQDQLLLPTTGKPAWDDRVGANGDSHQQSWGEIGAPGSNQLFDDSVTNTKDKFVFVKNTGDIDVYFRTIILVEAPEGSEIEEKGAIGIVGTSNSRYDWDTTKDGSQGAEEAKVYGYINVNGTRYAMLCAQYTERLAKDEISRPSLLQVYMQKKVTNEQIVLFGEKVDILVLSQAVQAEGYKDATTALNDAFGELNAQSHPWTDEVSNCVITTEAELRTFLKDGGNCVLGKNITLTGDLNDGWNVLPSVKTEAKLDLNGYVITNDTTTSNNFNMLFVGNSNGNLTISGRGKIEFTNSKKSNNASAAIYAISSSNITIDGGTYISDGSKYNIAVWAQDNSTVTINNGTFKNTNSVSDLIYAVGNATIYIKGGFFESASASNNDTLNIMGGANAKIIVSGGTFVNDDPSVEDADDTGKVVIASGYKVVSETQTNGDVWYTVVPE